MSVALGIGAAVAALCAAAILAGLRAAAPVPPPALRIAVPQRFVPLGGAPSPIPLPPAGSLTLSEQPLGVIADRDGQVVRPIGSVAKTMTALVALETHPLRGGDAGPTLTMSAADVQLYRDAVAGEGSAVPVAAGQRWDERDLLLALLLPSANNIAGSLARYLAGSEAAFAAQLNRNAAALGMTHTHFDDASGVSAGTVSTTRDLVLLGRAALRDPTLAALVATRAAVLPDGVRVTNLDTLLASQPGWLGIKTGWTPSAGGCLLFAAQRSYAGAAQPVVVVGAVLGQPPKAGVTPGHPELGGAFEAASVAVRSELDRNLAAVDVTTVQPAVSGSMDARWGASAGVAAGRAARRYAVLRRGEAFTIDVSLAPPAAPLKVHTVLGTLRASDASGTVVTWPLESTGSLRGPSLWWKVFQA